MIVSRHVVIEKDLTANTVIDEAGMFRVQLATRTAVRMAAAFGATSWTWGYKYYPGGGLLIICAGTNDCIGATAISDFTANLQNLISNHASCDVILMSHPPMNPATKPSSKIEAS